MSELNNWSNASVYFKIGLDKMEKIEFGILGSGWRAAFYLRIAKALPEKFAVTGIVSHSEEKRKKLKTQWAV